MKRSTRSSIDSYIQDRIREHDYSKIVLLAQNGETAELISAVYPEFPLEKIRELISVASR